MNLQRNHYEVLGVPETATTADIKTKYRELARKYHPDLAKDKALAQKIFSQINQAYRVLVDPERRGSYDMTLQAPRANQARANGSVAASNGAGSATATVSRPETVSAATTASRRTAATTEGPSSSNGRPSPAKPQESVPRGSGVASRGAKNDHNGSGGEPRGSGRVAASSVESLVAEADSAANSGDYARARALCERVILQDSRNAKAYAIMGDALTKEKKYGEAKGAYKKSLEVASSPLVQAKLDRLRISQLTDLHDEQEARATSGNPPTKDKKSSAKSEGGFLNRLFGRK